MRPLDRNSNATRCLRVESRSWPPASRKVIERGHLLGDEAAAAGSTRRAECLHDATAAGRHKPPTRAVLARGLAEARHKLDASVEKDGLQQSPGSRAVAGATLLKIVRSGSLERHESATVGYRVDAEAARCVPAV
jgi:hypothetical protein